MLSLSALSTVLLLLDPRPRTLILLTENLVWQPLSSVLPLTTVSVHLAVLLQSSSSLSPIPEVMTLVVQLL